MNHIFIYNSTVLSGKRQRNGNREMIKEANSIKGRKYNIHCPWRPTVVGLLILLIIDQTRYGAGIPKIDGILFGMDREVIYNYFGWTAL